MICNLSDLDARLALTGKLNYNKTSSMRANSCLRLTFSSTKHQSWKVSSRCILSDDDVAKRFSWLVGLIERFLPEYKNILHTHTHTILYLLIYDYLYLFMHLPPFFSFSLFIWFIIWCCSNACFVNATVLHFVALPVPLCPLANHLGPLSVLPVPPSVRPCPGWY